MHHTLQDLRFRVVRRVRPTAPALSNAKRVVAEAMNALRPALRSLAPGSKVAITVGSRGIDRLAEVVATICAVLRDFGLSPIIVPAMGSHAGATASGQKELIAQYGITEAAVGAPVISSMETVYLGQTPEGLEVCMDRVAWEAGHILVLNRVKMHTDFDGTVESGLMKMLSVGLGKVDGAASFHRNSLRVGYEKAILAIGRMLLATGRIIGGIGLVENDRHTLTRVAAAPAEQMEELDRQMLAFAKQVHGLLPFEELDLLIVDEMGKEISGAGMDTKVIGRAVHPDRELSRPLIRIYRIYVRNLTEESGGNASGMGLADAMHERIAKKVDFSVTYKNAQTALAYQVARMPMYFANDCAALSFLVDNLGSLAAAKLRGAWIHNTLALDEFLVSEGSLAELRQRNEYQISEETVPLQFGREGEIVTDRPGWGAL